MHGREKVLGIGKFVWECESGEGTLSPCLVYGDLEGACGDGWTILQLKPVQTCQGAGFEPQPESLEPRRRTGPVSPCLAIKLYLKRKGEAHIVFLPHSPPPHQPRGLPHKSYSPRGPSAPGAWVTLRLQENHFCTVNRTKLPYVCVLSSRPFLQEYSMCSILHSTGVCTCI